MSVPNSLPGRDHPLHPMRSAMLTALLLALPGAAQYTPSKSQFPSQQPAPPQTHSIDDFGDHDPLATERRMKALNEYRYKSIVTDTKKLLDLATELHSEIQSSNPDSLTPAQLRKWGEIEKLARRVKGNMTAVVSPEPAPTPPVLPPRR